MNALVLRPYQHAGVKHLLSMPFNRPHALLADEPGAGKTATTIEAAKQANCSNGLIVCPAIIKEQWARELVNWGLCQPDEIQVLQGLKAKLDNRPWCVVNYDLIRENKIAEQLVKRKWHCLTLDEIHRLKTHNSIQTKAVFHKSYGIGNSCYWKWGLSGTIVPNRPAELYPMLLTMAPEVIQKHLSWSSFIQRYCGGAFTMGRGASNIDELTERLQPFMLRRTLKDVWGECPDVIENELWFDVEYRKHPEWPTMFEATERRIVAESKVPQLAAYLTERLECGVDKIACFSFHRSVVEALEKGLAKFQPAKIYGGLGNKKRLEALAKFTREPQCRLILLQISSAGEGLDGLQHVTSECIEVEPEWSPGREDQAIRRILRIGQTKPVIVTKLFARDSYEEVIHASNKRKRNVINIIQRPNGGSFTVSIEANLERIASALEKLIIAVANKVEATTPAVPAPQAPPINFTPPPVAAPVTNAIPPVAAQSVPPPAAPAPDALANAMGAMVPPVMDRAQFQTTVMARLTPLGEQAGVAKLFEVLQKFGVAKLPDLPEHLFAQFLSFLP